MIDSLSPLDGRYADKVRELAETFSESGLIRSRLAIEVEWLVFLCNDLKLEGTARLFDPEIQALRKLYVEFQPEFAEEVKEIEKTTNHDVKAVEYFLRRALTLLKREDLLSFIHFACTSEDINNLAYAQMMKSGLHKVLIKALDQVLETLKNISEATVAVPMMAHTHGQPATPTTVGKELKNIGARLFRQVEQLK